jgi:hypothetical protein
MKYRSIETRCLCLLMGVLAMVTTSLPACTQQRPPHPAVISGKINFPDLISTAASPVVTFDFRMLDGSAHYVRTALVSPDGYFSFDDLPSQEYQVYMMTPIHLTARVYVNASEGRAEVLNATLLAGDINSDNSIDVLDLDILVQAFDLIPEDSAWNPYADLNGDERIDGLDLDILRRNFDRYGSPWPAYR